MQRSTPVRVVDIQVYDGETYKAEVERADLWLASREILPGIEAAHRYKVPQAPPPLPRIGLRNNCQGAMLGWEMSPRPTWSEVGCRPYAGRESVSDGALDAAREAGVTPVIISGQKVARAILTGKNSGLGDAADYFGLSPAAPVTQGGPQSENR